MVDWSMMRDFSQGPMVPFHGAENIARGRDVCCLEPTSVVAVYRAELPTCRSITWNCEMSRKRKRADSFSKKVGILRRQMMRRSTYCSPREAHIVSADAPVIHRNLHSSADSVLQVQCYFSACDCHFVRNPRRQECQAFIFT